MVSTFITNTMMNSTFKQFDQQILFDQSWSGTSFYWHFYFPPAPYQDSSLFSGLFLFLFLGLGIVQCFVFLGFLSLLENFGLETPIPIGIRVLGVETPL